MAGISVMPGMPFAGRARGSPLPSMSRDSRQRRKSKQGSVLIQREGQELDGPKRGKHPLDGGHPKSVGEVEPNPRVTGIYSSEDVKIQVRDFFVNPSNHGEPRCISQMKEPESITVSERFIFHTEIIACEQIE
jgi:hypothetical protein